MPDKTPTSRLQDDVGIAGSHLSADNHVHIHRHLGELWSISSPILSVSADDTYDIVVENPTDSGKELEVLFWSYGTDDKAQITHYRDTGIFDATAATSIEPRNFDGTVADGTQTFNAGYSVGTGDQLIDTANDARFNGGYYTTASQGGNTRATAAERSALDITVPEGDSFGIHYVDGGNGSNPIPALIVAEYEQGRNING